MEIKKNEDSPEEKSWIQNKRLMEGLGKVTKAPVFSGD